MRPTQMINCMYRFTRALVSGLHITPFAFPTSVLEGKPASVSCIVDADEPVAISWLKDGAAFSEDKPRINLLSAGSISTLAINQAQGSDQGNYTCRAVTATTKRQVSHSAALAISSPPKWLIEPRDTAITNADQTVTVDCAVKAVPPARIAWHIVDSGRELHASCLEICF